MNWPCLKLALENGWRDSQMTDRSPVLGYTRQNDNSIFDLPGYGLFQGKRRSPGGTDTGARVHEETYKITGLQCKVFIEQEDVRNVTRRVFA